jgi:hypothetical protein
MKIFKSAYFRHLNRPVFGSLSINWEYTFSLLSLA